MAGHTDDDFEEALFEDLGWRRIELTHLKRLLDSASRQDSASPAARGLSRAMISMCYAHWEGYSKNALERYARLVTRRKPPLSQAADGFVVEHVQRLVKRMSSGDETATADLIRAIRCSADVRLSVEKSSLADTRANLRYSVLEELLLRGCIPVDDFRLKANMIDVLLCDRRNAVAHGRALFVPAQESLELCDAAIELMETMRDVLVIQVRAKRYLLLEAAAQAVAE